MSTAIKAYNPANTRNARYGRPSAKKIIATTAIRVAGTATQAGRDTPSDRGDLAVGLGDLGVPGVARL
ncbi:hypothetical protein ABZX92_39660, partial [Lentzea sp. NPDC006480]|uniref:hypothetical protein n=1 Tax=Lentzea sp. NPDC006480 TaxID=3157176 RepID=UPI0033A9BA11